MMIDAVITKLAGVLIDTGTGKRIPFARRFDPETGEYEHLIPAPNGIDVLVDYKQVPLVRRGKAIGKLELVPFDDARLLGADYKPKKVVANIQPLGKDEKIKGLEQYKEVYVKVWAEVRGEARKVVSSKWDDFLRNNDFLDEFLIKGVSNDCAEGSKRNIHTS